MKEYKGYTVSEDGSVFRGGRKLSPWDNGRGYLILRICGKTKAVHRLVAECFVPNPENKPEVNHKDGDKYNNSASNLEWCTRSENIKHAYDCKLRSATGTENARVKTDEQTVREICVLIASGYKSSTIRDMGYDYNLVRAIKNKKNWSHISDSYF